MYNGMSIVAPCVWQRRLSLESSHEVMSAVRYAVGCASLSWKKLIFINYEISQRNDCLLSSVG